MDDFDWKQLVASYVSQKDVIQSRQLHDDGRMAEGCCLSNVLSGRSTYVRDAGRRGLDYITSKVHDVPIT